MRNDSAVFGHTSRAQILVARNLVAVVEVVERGKDWIGILDLDYGPVWKDTLHTCCKNLPLLVAVEVVTHEKSAAQQVFAHDLGLLVSQVPMAHLDGVEPRPMVNLVT